MGITLIVTKSYDRDYQETGLSIPLDQWLAFIDSDPDLRLRTEDWVAINPVTKEEIRCPAAEGEAQIKVGPDYLPFLRFRAGDLVTKFTLDLEEPDNPVRHKIAQVARHFDALIETDAGDGFFDWT